MPGMKTMPAQGLKKQWLTGSAAGVAMQGVGLGLAFASSVFMARVLGPEGLGRYGYVLAVVAVLSVFAAFGLPTVVARLLAAYQARGDNSAARGLLRWSGRVIGCWAILLALGLVAYGALQGADEQLWLYLWAAPVVPVLALTNLRQRALQAMHHPIAAQLPEQLVKHVVFLSMGGLLLWAGNKLPSTAEGAMAVWMVAASASLAVGILLLRHMSPPGLKDGGYAYRTADWKKIALPLFVADALGVVLGNSDTILLGMMQPAEEVGVYQVALRLSGLMLVLLGASNWVLAPWFAKFHALEDRERFQSVVTRSTRAVFLATLAIYLGMVLLGRPFLALFFGDQFQVAYPLMLILGAGQLVNVACGPVVNLLAMAGGQRELATGVGMAAAGNVLLCSLLVPLYGALGAAASTALVTCGYNVGLAMQVKSKLEIRATVLG